MLYTPLCDGLIREDTREVSGEAQENTTMLVTGTGDRRYVRPHGGTQRQMTMMGDRMIIVFNAVSTLNGRQAGGQFRVGYIGQF